MVKKQVLIAVADGSEEIETICPIDILRRADIDVTIAATGKNTTVSLSRGVKLVADTTIEEVSNKLFDMIVVPGGKGAQSLHGSPALTAMLKSQQQKNKLVAGICAAPFTVLQV
jgi:protein deglycase